MAKKIVLNGRYLRTTQKSAVLQKIGVSHVVLAILIPRGWELDSNASNVSEGVKLIVAKIVSMGTRWPFPKEHLRRLPWMIRLCEHASFGNMRWE
jgi:hypothetical protein